MRGLLPLLSVPAVAFAQEPSPTPRVGCLHGAPRPACASFWLIEFQASRGWLLHDPPPSDFADRSFTQYEWNLGHMGNVADHWALGATVSLGNGSDDIFTGVRGRVRRWLTPDLSMEVEAGVAQSNGDGRWYPALTAPSAGLRFNIQDRGSAFVRYDGFGAPDGRHFVGPDRPLEPWGRRAEVRGGIALGGKPALAATGVVVAVYSVFIVLYLAAGGGT